MFARAKQWARVVKRDVHALYLAGRDPRVPWYAKALALFVAGYALSPIDLIPDFIPGLGYLDDVFVAAILVDGMLNYVNRGLVLKYWPGSPESLERIARAARVLAAWVPRRLKIRIFSTP